jgi:hypothetical protein
LPEQLRLVRDLRGFLEVLCRLPFLGVLLWSLLNGS